MISEIRGWAGTRSVLGTSTESGRGFQRVIRYYGTPVHDIVGQHKQSRLYFVTEWGHLDGSASCTGKLCSYLCHCPQHPLLQRMIDIGLFWCVVLASIHPFSLHPSHENRNNSPPFCL